MLVSLLEEIIINKDYHNTKEQLHNFLGNNS